MLAELDEKDRRSGVGQGQYHSRLRWCTAMMVLNDGIVL